MKITTFKVPITLNRVGEGIELIINEDGKTVSTTRDLEEGSENDILKITKQISDFNENQKVVIKKTMLKSEDTTQGFIQMQILT